MQLSQFFHRVDLHHKFSPACKANHDCNTANMLMTSMKMDSKKRSLKTVMRKFSRFSIAEDSVDEPPLLKEDPLKGEELVLSSRSSNHTRSTVADDFSMSARSGAYYDELLESARYILDEDEDVYEEPTRFSSPAVAHDRPLQAPMRQLSQSISSCLLECSDRSEFTTSSRYLFSDADTSHRRSIDSSFVTGSSIDESLRSLGFDISARSVRTHNSRGSVSS